MIDLVRRHLASRLGPEDSKQNEESALYSELGAVLHRVLVWAETPTQERSMNPWLSEWRAEYGYAASDLRELAVRDMAARLGLDRKLREVADALDEVSTFRLSMGCGEQLEAVATRANTLASELKRDTVDKLPLSEKSIVQVKSLITESSRKLSDLADRAQNLVDAGKIEELKSQFGSMGRQLAQVSFYDLSQIGSDLSSRLREIGMGMRLIETFRIYMDGGVSISRLVEKVGEFANQLKEIAKT